MKNLRSLEFDLQLKEQRTMYWEKFQKIPALNDLTKNRKIRHNKREI